MVTRVPVVRVALISAVLVATSFTPAPSQPDAAAQANESACLAALQVTDIRSSEDLRSREAQRLAICIMDAAEYKHKFNFNGNYMDLVKGGWDTDDYSDVQRTECSDQRRAEATSYFSTRSTTYLSPGQIEAASRICAPTGLSCYGTSNDDLTTVQVVNRHAVPAKLTSVTLLQSGAPDQSEAVDKKWKQQGVVSPSQYQLYSFVRPKARGRLPAATVNLVFAIGDPKAPVITACSVDLPASSSATRPAPAALTEVDFSLKGATRTRPVSQNRNQPTVYGRVGEDNNYTVCLADRDQILDTKRGLSVGKGRAIEVIEDTHPCDFKRTNFVSTPKNRPDCAVVHLRVNHCVFTAGASPSISFPRAHTDLRLYGLGWENGVELDRLRSDTSTGLPAQFTLNPTRRFKPVRDVAPQFRVVIRHPGAAASTTTLTSEPGQAAKDGYQALLAQSGGKWTLHVSQAP